MWPKNFAEWGYGYCNWGPFGGNGLLGWLFNILLLVSAAYIGLWFIKQVLPKEKAAVPDNAFEILRKRYASGEITQSEYKEMKTNLSTK